jgi:hypothetical protein
VKDFSAHIQALRGDDGVEIQIGEAVMVAGLGSDSAAKHVGIGIRYTVPKH